MTEDSKYKFTESEIKEMKKIFLQQSAIIINEIKQKLSELSKNENPKILLIDIRRHLHTLSGDASLLNYTYVNTLSRKSEELINKIIAKNNHLNEAAVNLINQCIEVIEALIISSEKDSAALSNWAKTYKKIEMFN
jgi:chemotaxis protein histidine kinase CheA